MDVAGDRHNSAINHLQPESVGLARSPLEWALSSTFPFTLNFYSEVLGTCPEDESIFPAQKQGDPLISM
jgi:hypothetical protein